LIVRSGSATTDDLEIISSDSRRLNPVGLAHA
jgi:hypothetical protein